MNCGGERPTIKKVTMHGIDGDGNVVTIKLATQLNNMCGLLNEGVVIELTNFTTVIFTHGKDSIGKNC